MTRKDSINTNKPSAKTTRKGFTLVELALSIAFLGILSLTIALIINDTISTYRRGITLNQVNTVGMDLVDDIRTAFQNSTAKSVISECTSLYGYESENDRNDNRKNCEDDGGSRLVSVTKSAKVLVKKNKQETIEVPVYGALCTGSYSYIWNSGYYFNPVDYEVQDTPQATFKYNKDNKPDEAKDFRLLKVQDRTRAVCAYTMLENVDNLDPDNINFSVYDSGVIKRKDGVFVSSPNETVSEDPIYLLTLDNNDTTLALYDLQANPPIQSNSNNRLFYSVSFILGTIEGGINIMNRGNICSTPAEYVNSNLDYCAINKFNFAAQATGE